MKNMGGQAGPSRRGIQRLRDDELEDDLNSSTFRRNDYEHIWQAPPVPVRVPVNEMQVNVELGLGLGPGSYPEVVGSSDDDEVGSPTLIPQNSLDSMPSKNVRTDMPRASDLLMAVSACADPNKDRIIELSMAAMDELTKIACAGEPLWQRNGVNESESLNGLEYLQAFGSLDVTLKEIMKMVEVGELHSFSSLDENPLVPKKPRFEPLHIESSRESGIVSMDSINLVELLMDLNKWASTFSNMVSRATLLGVLLTGINNLVLQVDLRGSTGAATNYDRMLQVMSAEFHLPTAFVPSRKSHFARYCKRLASGTWGVVDVSLESLFPYPKVNFRRRPSGCIIQQMPNGCSKVIWVEHVEADNEEVHPVFRSLVSSGFAFGAKRWLATIIRHCKSEATLVNTSHPAPDILCGVIPLAGRATLLKVAERMTRSFWAETCASSDNLWITLPLCGAEDIKVRAKGNHYIFGRFRIPSIVFTTSIKLSSPPKTVYNFLRHENSRNKWDILAYGHLIEELAHIIKDKSAENRVSIMQVNHSPDDSAILYVQESYTDDTGAYMIYAPMDKHAMSSILNGGNPDHAIMLASGFVILPDRSSGLSGSILTISYHIVEEISQESLSPKTIESVRNVIITTSTLIKIALLSDNINDPVVESNSVPL